MKKLLTAWAVIATMLVVSFSFSNRAEAVGSSLWKFVGTLQPIVSTWLIEGPGGFTGTTLTLSSGATIDGSLTVQGQKIATGSSLTKTAADGMYVNVGGDTMTGALDMSTNLINALATPVVSTDAANKEYVDSAVTALNIAYFLLDAGSAVPTYKDASTEESALGVATATGTALVDDELIQVWVTATGSIFPTELIAGIYDLHVHASKPTGTKVTRLYWNLYERKTGGAETLVFTSENSPIITAVEGEFDTHGSLTGSYILTADSKLVFKVYADVGITGSAPTIQLAYQGTTASHFSLPSNIEALNDIYVRRDGARPLTADWDAGAFEISAKTMSGDLLTASGGQINLVYETKTIVLFGSGTTTATGANIFGNWEQAFSGSILSVYAYVGEVADDDVTEVDVLINGTSIFTTTVTIDATEDSSRDAATPAVIDLTKDDYGPADNITFAVNAPSTNPATTLTLTMVREIHNTQ